MHTSQFTRIPGILSAVLSLALLGGCMSDSEDSGTGDGGFSVTTEAKVTKIQAPAGDSAGKIESELVEYSCEGNNLVADTLEESQSYLVNGGNLYLWDSEDCEALKLQGSSSTVIGKWTTT